jgi:CHASE3 domain sensor protein
MSVENEEKSVSNGEVREGANVDKIRDILFGSQMRDYEKRFVRLEERLAKASDALRDDLKKRFDSLESFVQQEMEALSHRLKTEKSERVEALKELTRESRDSAKSLEHKLSALEEQLAGAQGDLRSRILEQSKSLGSEIRKAQSELEAALEREATVLRHEKTDRETLGDLFSELGLRLRGELQLPEK